MGSDPADRPSANWTTVRLREAQPKVTRFLQRARRKGELSRGRDRKVIGRPLMMEVRVPLETPPPVGSLRRQPADYRSGRETPRPPAPGAQEDRDSPSRSRREGIGMERVSRDAGLLNEPTGRPIRDRVRSRDGRDTRRRPWLGPPEGQKRGRSTLRKPHPSTALESADKREQPKAPKRGRSTLRSAGTERRLRERRAGTFLTGRPRAGVAIVKWPGQLAKSPGVRAVPQGKEETNERIHDGPRPVRGGLRVPARADRAPGRLVPRLLEERRAGLGGQSCATAAHRRGRPGSLSGAGCSRRRRRRSCISLPVNPLCPFSRATLHSLIQKEEPPLPVELTKEQFVDRVASLVRHASENPPYGGALVVNDAGRAMIADLHGQGLAPHDAANEVLSAHAGGSAVAEEDRW